MKRHYDDFRALKDDTTAPAPPPLRRASGGRTNMRVAGNPDVLAEAEGREPYAMGDEGEIGQETNNKKKHGGKVKKHRRRDGGGKHIGMMTGRIRSTAPTSGRAAGESGWRAAAVPVFRWAPCQVAFPGSRRSRSRPGMAPQIPRRFRRTKVRNRSRLSPMRSARPIPAAAATPIGRPTSAMRSTTTARRSASRASRRSPGRRRTFPLDQSAAGACATNENAKNSKGAQSSHEHRDRPGGGVAAPPTRGRR